MRTSEEDTKLTDAIDYITDEVRAMIGAKSAIVEGPEPVDRSSIRRFVQAIMDDDPLYSDDATAQARGYAGVVAPPLFPLHSIRRHHDTPDPLDAMIENPNYDGAGDFAAKLALAPLPLPLRRLLNGGNSVEVWSLVGVGETITAQSEYEDVYQKQGSQGPLVFCIVKTAYAVKGSGRPLLTARQVHIRR